MKISVNIPCPCGSQNKYKNCCQKYHKGMKAKDALTLMKSRYSAFVVCDSKYIMKTTHPKNPDYHDDKKEWQKSIENFSKSNTFLELMIEKFWDEKEYAYVIFKAKFLDGELYEKSRFSLKEGVWLYLDGEFL